MTDEPKLYPEDQAKVDAYLKRGYNAVERQPFKPLKLLFILAIVVTAISIFSLIMASTIGAY